MKVTLEVKVGVDELWLKLLCIKTLNLSYVYLRSPQQNRCSQQMWIIEFQTCVVPWHTCVFPESWYFCFISVYTGKCIESEMVYFLALFLKRYFQVLFKLGKIKKHTKMVQVNFVNVHEFIGHILTISLFWSCRVRSLIKSQIKIGGPFVVLVGAAISLIPFSPLSLVIPS